MTPSLLHAANPGPFTGDGNWTYLIPGVAPVLIDAGVGKPAHLARLVDAAPGGPSQVLVTHAHTDHASGAPAIRTRFPAARFAKFPWPGKDADVDVAWEHLAHGDRVETGEGDLQVVHTPGHSPDHVAFWHAESGTLFSGDLLVAGSTVFIPASTGGSLTDYLASLRAVLALTPRRAWPAHGPAIDDPEALIHHYLSHRQAREDQVIDALDAGLATVEDITARIYADLTAALEPMARESVLAHLRKLEDEGRARYLTQRWGLAPERGDIL